MGLWHFEECPDVQLLLGMWPIVIVSIDTFAHGPLVVPLGHGNLDLEISAKTLVNSIKCY